MRLIPALAVLAFLALGVGMTERMTVFSEELMILPTPAWRVIALTPGPDGHVRYEPSCADEPRPRFILSGNRPTLAWCVDGRSFPVMSAPQFSSVFLWPIALLQRLHHDDPFIIRKILLGLGALSIALTHRAVTRLFGGSRLAALAAVGVAVSPCFVLISSIIQQFESFPWTFLVAAVILCAGCPELAPRREGEDVDAERAPSTARLTAAAFCVGLSVLANVKAVFLLVPSILLALRLGARAGVIRKHQWALMIAAGLVALTPMAMPIAMDPSMEWAQGRGPDFLPRLLANLREPQRVAGAVRDLLLFWSNPGYYFARDHINPASLAIAAAVFVFVIADTIRTLRQRRGCVVTAACGVFMLSMLGVVTLLYTDFPANYAPLHAVYGVALGCAAHRLVEVAKKRLPPPAAGALAASLFVPFAWNSVETARSFAEIPFVTNTRVERDLTRYLLEHPEPGSVPVTINLLAGGVVDALSEGRIRSIQAHVWLRPCEARELLDHGAQCFHDRFRALLETEANGRALRVILPTNLALVHRPAGLETLQREALERAARELGLGMRLEQTFTTPSGTPAALLYRVGR